MKKIFFCSYIFALLYLYTNTLSALIARVTVFAKLLNNNQVQCVILCGDNHIIGTPQDNLNQFYILLNESKKYNIKVNCYVENQRMLSPFFNDQYDQQLVKILQQDVTHKILKNEPGSLTILSLFGRDKKYFPQKYQNLIEHLITTNIECRQFLFYTSLLNNQLLALNLSKADLIKEFKKIQEQKCKKFSFNNLFKTPEILMSYSNNTQYPNLKIFFEQLKIKLTNDTKKLINLWQKNFVLKDNNILQKPIWTLHLENKQIQTTNFNGIAVQYYKNIFDDQLCPTLLEYQLFDEMIEANALWHITNPYSPKRILVITGSVHTGQYFDLISHTKGMAKLLSSLGYKELVFFGVEDINNVSQEIACQLSKKTPQVILHWLSKTDTELSKLIKYLNKPKNL
jgi:hypothetical protein